jgi:hypothetical protein|tara:strand:+ start:3198 stop:3473 length:276 start_codon:yes stop_codon:yes gene_type:complete
MPQLKRSVKPKKKNPKVKGTGTGSILGQAFRAYNASLPRSIKAQDKIWAEWRRLSPTRTRKRVSYNKAANPGIGRPPRSRTGGLGYNPTRR